ncbi:MAG: type II toxin-antitoxin system RelE/ParE family toxin [Nanoarchaeota archaeon]
MYLIEYSDNAKKFLKKLDLHLSSRIIERIEKLILNPVPSDVKFIGREDGEKIFRYRIGDFRALYVLKEEKRIILITKIDKRSKVYD